MREIRFRAWDKESQKMTRVYTLDELLANACSLHEAVKDDYEWMQFTGVLDKNSKEIYEGDIVRKPDGRTCEVIWFQSPSYCGWDLMVIESQYVFPVGEPPPKHKLWDCEWEVIGNIYETEVPCK